MATQSDKIAKLEKEVAIISERIKVIKDNHLFHIEKDISTIKKVVWTAGFLLFSNMIAFMFTMLQ
tara:strand:- start:693 stop:887 length:195 start_codon:yes stop_codon:yes gene_type:complete